MNPICEKIIDDIIAREGGFVDSPSDSGGPTNFGITEHLARSYGYDGDMEDLPREKAVEIYKAEFWDKLRADQLFDISPAVCEEVVDTGVNCGPYWAVRFLQEWLNVFNVQGAYYRDMIVDGRIGNVTLAALESYCIRRDPDVLVKGLNCSQGARYKGIAERRGKDEDHIYGWLKNRV